MKILDLAKLGHTNVFAFKKRSFMTVVVIGILFGVLFTFLFSFYGLEKFLLSYASQATNGSVITANSICVSWEDNSCTPDDMLPKIADLISNYGGEIEGVRYFYQLPEEHPILLSSQKTINSFSSLPAKVTESLNIPRSKEDSTDSSALHIITPFSKAQELSEIRLNKTQTNEKILENTEKIQSSTLGKVFINKPSVSALFVSGIYPNWPDSFSLSKKVDTFNILDLVLSQVYNSDDSEVYLTNVSNSQEIEQHVEPINGSGDIIVRFNDLNQAYAYYSYANCNFAETQCDRGLSVRELFSNQLNIKQTFSSFRRLFKYISVVIIVIGIIIMVFTLIRLIDQDSQSIALFRSLGASGADIFVIYLFFLLELCALAATFAVFIGIILSIIISIFNNASLAATIATHYLTIPKNPIVLFGINSSCFVLIVIMLTIAPLCLLLSIDHFSNKNIAKRMKQA